MSEYYPCEQTLESIKEFKRLYWSPEEQKKFLIRPFWLDTRKVKAPIRFPKWSSAGFKINLERNNTLNGSFEGIFLNERFTIKIEWKNYESWLMTNALSFVPKDTDGKSSTIMGTVIETFPLSPDIAAKNPNANPLPRTSKFKFINSVLVKGDWLSFIDVYAGVSHYVQW